MSSPGTNGSTTTNALQHPPVPLVTAKQWVRWRLEKNRLGRLTKRPDQSFHALDRLRTFREVAAAGPIDSTQGIGFVLFAGRPLQHLGGVVVGIDADACIGDGGAVSPWAIDMLRLVRSYTEVSPSGHGLRIWVAATGLPDRRMLRARVRVEAPAPPGVDKAPEVQLFGAGSTGYCTFTGNHVGGTPDDVRAVDLMPFLERFGLLDAQPAEPLEPEGDAPSADEIEREILRHTHGRQMLDAQWRQLDKPSASEAYFSLVLATLRAARGHQNAAVAFLLTRTAWGSGDVEDSAEPDRYGRERWVAKEVSRAASKAPAQLTAADVFEPLGPLPEGQTLVAPAPAEPAAPSPIDTVWGAGPAAGALDEEPPPREFLLHRATPTGFAGFLPMQKTAVLASEGGVGKTNLLVQLAVSIATGRPWLGFRVDERRAGQHVLLLLAEEDEEEVLRRLWAASQQLALTHDERETVLRLVVALPLAGSSTPLVLLDPSGEPRLTTHFAALERRLHAGGPWAFVGLDPMARLFPGAESANEQATYAVQAAERLCRVPGRPALGLAHHSSKMSRRAGSVDVRGVTGLPDAARSNLMLRHLDGGGVEMSFGKANYGPRFEPIRLVRETGRGMGGLLRLAGADDVRAADDAAVSAEVSDLQTLAQRLTETLQKHGPTSSLDVLRKMVGRRRVDCSAALAHAVENGLVRREQHGRVVRYAAKGPLDDLLT